MTTPPGWDGILDQDETILWQGRPDTGISLGAQNIVMLVFGLFFSGFALFWMAMASMAGGYFWMFGLIHFAVGLGIAFGAILWGPFRRRHSWYTLTDRRAFVATDLPVQGKRLKSWPIDADTALELVDGPLQTVNFATEMRRGKNGRYEVAVGFERLRDGKAVYRLMRDTQARTRNDAAPQRT